jgi:hypothetical protein
MTRVVISQPMYFPWVGFIAQMSLADVMIWLDDAQFSKGSFTNRVQVKTEGGIKWMSIPLAGKGSNTLIGDLTTIDDGIFARHRSLLQNAFHHAPFADEVLETFDAVPTDGPLVQTVIASAEVTARAIGLPDRRTLISSRMNVPGRGSARVLDLVKAAGGTTYITGHGARNYLDHDGFEQAGVSVEYMKYDPVPWPQPHGAFTPYVTALDLVAAVGAGDRAAHLAPATTGWRDFVSKT